MLKALVQSPLPVDQKFLPLLTTILSVKIVFSWTNKGCRSILRPTHPPTPDPPPRGGVGTLGQIAPNQTDPPTHGPQTHLSSPLPRGVGLPLSKGLIFTTQKWG